MKKYTIKQLALLAKVSPRTLHYYDEIKLLIPTEKTPKGYRVYVHKDLLRLQQIMLYKELGFSLTDIQKILDDAKFDIKKALIAHRAEIAKRHEQFKELLVTIDATLRSLQTNKGDIDEVLYKGFTPEQAEEYRQEAMDRWGEKTVLDSEARLKKLGKAKLQQVFKQGEEITRELARLMSEDPENYTRIEVQECIDRWAKHLNYFHPVTQEYLRGLGNLYVEDTRFTQFYEKFGSGLALFKNKAIQYYCDHLLLA